MQRTNRKIYKFRTTFGRETDIDTHRKIEFPQDS